MVTVKQINIKNGTYHFYNDIIGLENFDSSLLKLDKKSYKDIGICNIGYITIKKIGECKKYLQCESFIFTYYPRKWIYRRNK